MQPARRGLWRRGSGRGIRTADFGLNGIPGGEARAVEFTGAVEADDTGRRMRGIVAQKRLPRHAAAADPRRARLGAAEGIIGQMHEAAEELVIAETAAIHPHHLHRRAVIIGGHRPPLASIIAGSMRIDELGPGKSDGGEKQCQQNR